MPNANKKVWWICERNHEWEATISSRNNGAGCPCCASYAGHGYSLSIKNPELSKQWHPTKNGNLTPMDVTLNSSRKVWWICEKNHEWDAIVNARAKGNGCPYCAGMSVVFSFSTRRAANLPYRFTGRTSGHRIHLLLFLLDAHFFESKIFSVWFVLLEK